MNAKFRILCRVVGIALLAAGIVQVIVEALHSATFHRIPEYQGFAGAIHISLIGVVGVVVGGLLIFFGFRVPGKPSR